MPIEIRELVIRAEVHSGSMQQNSTSIDEETLKALRREILQACTDRMKMMLRDLDER